MNLSKQREEALFEAALQLPADQRSVYLEKTCVGDQDLRHRVEVLLGAFGRAGDFMRQPAVPLAEGAARLPFPPTEKPGDRFGGYRLLEQIGEGGCGVVYVAEQEEPVRRRVALKVIKVGMDTKQVIARFEAERQALAMMDHPNIAKIHDAGTTGSGRPFFVMELVRGVRITDYCQQNGLSLRERLDVFIQVCRAIQHAHQKGIIHRDIKPSNILVSVNDGVALPKVIDFGIAKATQGRLTEQTVHTGFEQFIGTPAYTSPEQAVMTSLDIDTRSDVYSLGVLLYELLTGTTPFDAKELLAKGLDTLRRTILEVDPVKPSTRLTQARGGTNEGREEGKNGGHAFSRSSPLPPLSTDLDWIVMKCLEKDRTRRYETAHGLAADLTRHLDNEPVLARPPSAAYQFRKFARRNRVALGVAGVVAVLLVLGMIGTGLALQRALRAESSLRGQLAETQKAQKAEQERAHELEQVSIFQAGMLNRIDATLAGADLIADLHARFVVALERAGVPEGERQTQSRALREHLARVNSTDAAAAMIDRTILSPAIQTIDRWFQDQPKVDAELRQALSYVYQGLGLYDAAFPLQQRALETRRGALGDEHPLTLNSVSAMGFLLRQLGRFEEAEPHHREALERRRRLLGEEHPGTIESIIRLGALFREQGRFDEAEPYVRDGLEKSCRVLGEEHPETLGALDEMGDLLAGQRKLDEAERYWREALEKSRRALGEEHPRTIKGIENLGGLLYRQHQFQQAEPYWQEALEKSRRVLGENHPRTIDAIDQLVGVLNHLGRHAEAERESRRGLEACARAFPSTHPITACLLHHHAEALIRLGRLEDAAGQARRAMDMYRGHPDWTPKESLHARLIHGRILIAQGKPEEALTVQRETVEYAQRVLGGENDSTLKAMDDLGHQLRNMGRLAEAEPYWREVLEKRERVLGEQHPDTIYSMNTMGLYYLAQRRPADAEAVLARGLSAQERAFPSPKQFTAVLLHHHADALRALGRLSEARAGAERAAALYRAHPDWSRQEAVHALSILGKILTALEKPDEAQAAARELQAVQQQIDRPAGPENGLAR